MKSVVYEQMPDLFAYVASVFDKVKDELCEMDAHMGDGDLGLTMRKGFKALADSMPTFLEECRGDIGKLMTKSAMKMSAAVPSTMGTLMSSGIMGAGKGIGVKETLDAKAIESFIIGFKEGLEKRGKCQPGDRTVLDTFAYAMQYIKSPIEEGKDIDAVIIAAYEGACAGVEATKGMIPKFGKAAVFAKKAEGIADQGAVAGMYLLKAMKEYITSCLDE